MLDVISRNIPLFFFFTMLHVILCDYLSFQIFFKLLLMHNRRFMIRFTNYLCNSNLVFVELFDNLKSYIQ